MYIRFFGIDCFAILQFGADVNDENRETPHRILLMNKVWRKRFYASIGNRVRLVFS